MPAEQLVGDLVVIVPAGVAIAICTALIWYWRSRRRRSVTPARREPPSDEIP